MILATSQRLDQLWSKCTPAAVLGWMAKSQVWCLPVGLCGWVGVVVPVCVCVMRVCSRTCLEVCAQMGVGVPACVRMRMRMFVGSVCLRACRGTRVGACRVVYVGVPACVRACGFEWVRLCTCRV